MRLLFSILVIEKKGFERDLRKVYVVHTIF
jgi:hypothetical protein